MRAETEDAARKVHELIGSGITPRAEYSEKCNHCSLVDLCLPKTCGKSSSAGRYLVGVLKDLSEEF
ncbi:MAG: Dna2/Cas4 domain-containing protein [Armatimonadetes bacterium]|nr:Dna2/Cas4 domain-containing protein [Armatimonadota bacterium]